MREGTADRRYLVLALSVLIIIPAFSGSNGSGSSGRPDLTVSGLWVEPAQDGFIIHIDIKNIGSDVDSSTALLMDSSYEYLNDTDVISELNIGGLRSGSSYEKEINWIPRSAGDHLVYLVLDVQGEVNEVTERNNMMGVTVTFPDLIGVSSSFDGDLDPDVLGTYISGISSDLSLYMEYDSVQDLSLLRTFVQIGNGSKTYASSGTEGVMTASFDPGILPPGEHIMSINTSYCGVPLPERRASLIVAEPPPWSMNLSSRQDFYDPEQNCYSISGRMDIPEYTYLPEFAEETGDDGFNIGITDGELLIRSYVLADGTTTINSGLDLRIDTCGKRFTLSSDGLAFSSSPYGPFSSTQSSVSDQELDIGDLLPFDGITVQGPYGYPIKIPYSPLVSGTIGSKLILDLPSNSSDLDISLFLSLDLSGGSEQIHSFKIPGMDRPLTYAYSNISWSSGLSLEEKAWNVIEDIDANFSASFTDLGLSTGLPVLDSSLQDVGSDIFHDEEQGTATVMIAEKEGSISKIIFQRGDEESEVYSNNTYLSSPKLSLQGDGRSIVVWTEASYDENIVLRASSLGLRGAVAESSGNGSFSLLDMPDSDGMCWDQDLATSPVDNLSALIWVKDMDSDPLSIDDTEIFVSVIGSGHWSAPVKLTDDDNMDSEPSVKFTSDGDLWAVWKKGSNSIGYSIRDLDGTWSSPGSILTEQDAVVKDIAFSDGPSGSPVLISSIINGNGEFELTARTANPSRQTSWDDPYTFHVGTNWIEEPSSFTDAGGDTTVVWREYFGGSSDLIGAVLHFDGSKMAASDPMTISSDDKVQLGTQFAPADNGEFIFAFDELPVGMVNTLLDNVKRFHSLNMSWGARIKRTSVDPDKDYTPGTMVRATATLEYLGFGSPGSSRVDVYRRYLDRSTGELKEEFWASSMVGFDRISGEQQVDFTVTVREYQLGISIYSVVPDGVGPEYLSSIFIPMASVPDPEISSLEILSKEGMNTTIGIDVHNWGTVAVGGRGLEIWGYNSSLNRVLPGSLFEPLFSRERSTGDLLNSTEVFIEPGATGSFRMNFTAGYGINHIWARLSSNNWEPAVIGHQDIFFLRSQDVSFTFLEDPFSNKMAGFSPHVDIGLELRTDDEPDELPFSASHLVIARLLDGSSTILWENRSIQKINGTNSFFLLRDQDVQFGPGSYRYEFLVIPLDQFHLNAPIVYRSISRFKVEGPVLIRMGDMKEDTSGSQRGIMVSIQGQKGPIVDVYHLTLYNGFPEDNVVLSESIGLNLKGDSSRNQLLLEDLAEGTYLLSVVLRTPVINEEDGSISWIEESRTVKEIEIKASEDIDPPQDRETDWDDVTDSIIFSTSAIMIVLLISSLLYQRKDGNE